MNRVAFRVGVHRRFPLVFRIAAISGLATIVAGLGLLRRRHDTATIEDLEGSGE
jgi:hypothetical protein